MWFVTYIVTAAVLLVNMLIASKLEFYCYSSFDNSIYLVMGNTYAMVNERKKEWLRQWAKIMLIIEQSVSRKERLAQQSNYSKRMPDGSLVLITRLIQTVINFDLKLLYLIHFSA
jgi:transient receptor potential cation channel subfamily V protein 5